MGFFSSKSVTTDPLSAYTPEQRAMLSGLMSLANTGSGLGINLGEAYGGSLGNFQSTGQEQAGLSKLMELLGGQNPNLAKAGQVYTDFANTKFNPDDPSSGFAAFSRQVARATGKADDALNREAAATGSRFGTGILQRKQDLDAQRSDSLQAKLAELFNLSENRKLQGAQGLAGLASQEQGLARDVINYGSLERELKNQEAQAQYSEFQRQRSEQLSRIGLAQDSTKIGLAPVTEKMPSAFSKFAAPIFSSIGTAAAGPIGGAIGNRVGSIFTGTSNTQTPSSMANLLSSLYVNSYGS